MKAARGGIAQAVDQPNNAVRLYLFHGPDEGQSRALGERLLKGLGATRFVVAASAIKSDPAVLADEAAAMSLFGGARAIWIEPAGDEVAEAATALLNAPACESATIAIAGILRRTSALLKLAESHSQALAHASYTPEGRDAERMVADIGRTCGLRVAGPVAARIADACGNDQAIVVQELSKLALYLDASPEAPKELDHDAVDAVGAAMPEGDFLRLADLALSGRMSDLANELIHLPPGGSEAIPVVRAIQRRLLMLAPLRARIEQGERVDGVMTSADKALFWKDKPLIGNLLASWDAKALETAADRVGKLERQMMLSPVPTVEALGEELTALARAQAARRR